MNQKTFPFKLGNFQCMAIRDSVWPGEESNSLYPEVTPARAAQILRQHHIQIPPQFDVNCLLVRTGQHNILVDAGWGDSPKPDSGMLVAALQSEGISPREIDIVINSHGHPDHIGGNTDSEGKPSFPNCRYYVNQKEYQYWSANPDLKEFGDKEPEVRHFVNKNLLSLKERLCTVDDEAEIIPGIRLLPAPGHTPGHSACTIFSQEKRLLFVADVFHSPLGILNPRWRMRADSVNEEAIATRLRILEMASSSGALVFGCHLPFPGLGHVVKQNDVFIWKAIRG